MLLDWIATDNYIESCVVHNIGVIIHNVNKMNHP